MIKKRLLTPSLLLLLLFFLFFLINIFFISIKYNFFQPKGVWGATGKPPSNQILVFIESGSGFDVENNGQWILPGEDAVFTIQLDRGTALTGTDYPGETLITAENRTVTLTLLSVQVPARVRLSISTKYITVSYDGNGALSPSGEAVVEKRCSISSHPRPNTENGRDMFSREGCTLVSWNTRSDGKGERIGLGSRVSGVNGAVRLYAQWLPWADPADFDWTGEEAVTITGCRSQAETLVIPSFLDGKPVEAIAEGAFTGCPAAEIVLPEHLKTVENGAFRDCALSVLTLFDTVVSVSDAAFENCPSLKTLRINALEAPFGYIYRKESVYADKVELLLKAQGRKKLVFYGGCSMWYNLDALQMVNAFGEEYAVINMGLNGTVSSAVQLQILSSFLEEGDVLFHTPEISSRPQLMLFTGMGEDDVSLWSGLESNYDLFALVDLQTVDGVLDSLCYYLGKKNQRTDYQHFFSDDYSTSYIDAYGSVPFYRSGTKKSLADTVSLKPSLVEGSALDTLKAYYALLAGRGVQILVSHACVNMDAVPEDQRDSVERVDSLFRQSLSGLPGVRVISRLSDYLYHQEDFYDTNYHLCSQPAKANTAQWLSDLRQAFSSPEVTAHEE